MDGSDSNIEIEKVSFFKKIFRPVKPDISLNTVEGQFQTTLSEIYDPNLITLGHATDSLEHAKNILTRGLLIAHLPFSSYTADQLLDSQLPLENQKSAVLNKMRAWPHKYNTKLPFMVVIQLPQSDNQEQGTSYFERFIQKLPHYETVPGILGEKFTHLLPSQYIRGYVDLQSGLFAANPNFKSSNVS